MSNNLGDTPQKKVYIKSVIRFIFLKRGHKMNISIKQALTAPLSWKLLIVALLAAFPVIFAFYYGIDTTGELPVMPGQPITLYLIIAVTCSLLISGYCILFAHNRINNKTPIFPNISWPLIKTSLKNIVFGLGTYVVMLFMASIMIIAAYLPLVLAMPIVFVALILVIYYIIVATLRFMDTLSMSTPFNLGENFSLMGKYWKSFLLLFLYNLLVIIVLGIPSVLIQVLVLGTIMHAYPSFESAVATVFVSSLFRSYIVFVCLGVTAQVYAWIKADRATKAGTKTITVKPVSVTIVDKPAAKKASPLIKPATKKATAKVPAKKAVAPKKAATPVKKATAKVAVKPAAKAKAKPVKAAPKKAVKKK